MIGHGGLLRAFSFARLIRGPGHVQGIYPFVIKHAIVGYLRLPQPTPAPALMRVLHWLNKEEGQIYCIITRVKWENIGKI